MARIFVFSDEIYCTKHTFRLGTLLWGSPQSCNDYTTEISSLIGAHRDVLGNGFKEFHATQLKRKNWIKLSPVYDQLIRGLMLRVQQQKLGVLIYLFSKERWEGNAVWLKEIVKKGVTNRESDFGLLFKSLDSKDLPLLYHSVDQLFPLLFYCNRIGAADDEFEYYPDAVGNILQYKNKFFQMSGTLPFSLPIDFYSLLYMLGDSFLKMLPQMDFPNWPTITPTLKKFEPTASHDSYMIQACDLISHCLVNHLKFLTGSMDEIHELKSQLISQYINLTPTNGAFASSFNLDNGELRCINPKVWGTINMHKL